jgi:glycosyltransferase involved in cell wall biosynthesis
MSIRIIRPFIFIDFLIYQDYLHTSKNGKRFDSATSIKIYSASIWNLKKGEKWMSEEISKLTLSMIVKNEANRYLEKVLTSALDYIDEAVIIDDASTDHTVARCKEILHHIPLHLIENKTSQFSNEVVLRKQQWQETIKTNPKWILNLDADEKLEDSFANQVQDIQKQDHYDAVYFRLYDMWDESHYRQDTYWKAHFIYRPFLIRYRPDIDYIWEESAQHCGRFPTNICHFPYICNNTRIQHYGWASPEDRKKKYQRYMKYDPLGKFGWKEQYESILDEHPNLIHWDS